MPFRGPLLRVSIGILIFLVFVAVTVITLRPIQLGLHSRMEAMRDTFIRSAEGYWGCKLQYGSMGPSIFGALDIRNVLVLREDDSVLLSISRLRLSYSLLELLRGHFNGVFQSIRIDRPVLSLDFKKDSGLGERVRELQGPNAAGKEALQPQNGAINFREFIPENFSFRVWNGEWELSGSGNSLKLRGVGLDAAVRRNRISFQGRWDADASFTGENALSALNSIFQNKTSVMEAVMSGRFSGEYAQDANEGSATVVIPTFSGSNFRLKPLTISFFLSGDELEIRKTHDKSPSAFSFVYNLENAGFRANFEGENFTPQDLLVFTDSWKDYNAALAFRVSGSAGMERDSSGSVSYNIDFSGMLPGNSITGPASFTAKASGDSGKILVNVLDISTPNGNLDFRGGMAFKPAAPYGSLSLSNFRLHGDNGISGDFTITSQGRDITIFGDNFTASGVNFSAMDASLHREDNGLSFAVSALRFRNMESEDIQSYEDVRMSRISLQGSVDYDPSGSQPGHIQASLLLDSFCIGDIISILEPVVSLPALPYMARLAAKDLSVTTEVFFTTDYQHILYNAPRFVMAYEGVTDVMAVASLSGTNSRFELSDIQISWNKGNAELNCSADFSDPSDISFSLNAVYNNFTYYFEGVIQDQKNVSVRGSYGLQVSLRADDTGAYSGYAQCDSIPFSSGDNTGALSFLFTLNYSSPEYWQAVVERFEISGLATPASSNSSVRLTGTADQNGLDIPNIYFNDGKGPLTGNIACSWDPSYSFCRFKMDLFGSNGSEYYGINGSYQGKGLELSFTGQGMQLSRISSQNAVADSSLRLSWQSPSSFSAEASVSSFIWRGQDDEIRASAEASINNDTFSLRQLKINYSGLEATVPYLTIDRAANQAETEVQIGGSFSGRPVNVSLRGEAKFNESETWIDLPGSFDTLDGSLNVDAARYDTIQADDPFKFVFSCRKEKDGFAFSLSGGPRNMIRLRYEPESSTGGNFYAALAAPSPVRGSLTGSIDGKTIDAQGTDLYVDLGSLWRFIPPSVDAVMFPGGFVTGSIRITGPLSDPEFFGTARATSVQILVPQYLPVAIRPVPTTFYLNGNEMTFGPTDAIVGQGGGKASGTFRFERWIPSIFSIDIQVPQSSAIPYSFDIAGIIANGLASGRLIVALEDSILSITGDLTADNTEISLNGNEMAAAKEVSDSTVPDTRMSVQSDFTIRAGRRLEFFWPSVNLPILQANADMGSAINFTTDSLTRRFALTGDIKLRSGEIFYFERNFYIKEGTLYFNENETQFDPRISARAEIRDQADTGPVTISMIIDNAPLRSFTPRFESSPPLSQLEIYALLGQNPQGGAVASQRNPATSAFFDSLAQFTVIQRLQRQVRDFLGLDMLSVRTQIFQNVLLQATGTQNQTTPSGGYRVGNYFDNSTVFLGKYLGPNMFGQAMLSFKYDENQVTWGGLKLEPEIGLEMRSPLFDIEFSMVPLHPEYYFISDVSFSLIWRKTF